MSLQFHKEKADLSDLSWRNTIYRRGICAHVHSCTEVKRNSGDEAESICSKGLSKSCSEKGNKIKTATNRKITCWYSNCMVFREYIICKWADWQGTTWL